MTTATLTDIRTYQIDKAHSEVTFQVRHLLTKVRGQFSDFEGTVEFDPADPARSGVRLTVQAASIGTNQPDRDAHLRSADFFDVQKYPTLTFVSRTVTPQGRNEYDVEGDLTIHGVTKAVTLPVSYLGESRDPWGNEKVAFETDVTLNRKDFGLLWNVALETGGFLVGEEVRISISVQAN